MYKMKELDKFIVYRIISDYYHELPDIDTCSFEQESDEYILYYFSGDSVIRCKLITLLGTGILHLFDLIQKHELFYDIVPVTYFKDAGLLLT